MSLCYGEHTWKQLNEGHHVVLIDFSLRLDSKFWRAINAEFVQSLSGTACGDDRQS